MTTTMSGPLFNGDAERITALAAQAIERDLAVEGEQIVARNLDTSLRNPTGYYESQVEATPEGGDWEVTDNGVVYGPWLEGVGSRNQTTRFKGYATFRRAAQELQRRAGPIAQRAAEPFLRRLG